MPILCDNTLNNVDVLHCKLATFRAGNLSKFLPLWREITSDPSILQYVEGFQLSFTENIGPSREVSRLTVFDAKQLSIVADEVQNLLLKDVLKESLPEPGEFISKIFLRPKSDGSFRMILNLKQLNEFLEYRHFKMDTLHMVTKMIRPGCFMAFVDLKDVHYTVPIHPASMVPCTNIHVFPKGCRVHSVYYLLNCLSQCMLLCTIRAI